MQSPVILFIIGNTCPHSLFIRNNLEKIKNKMLWQHPSLKFVVIDKQNATDSLDIYPKDINALERWHPLIALVPGNVWDAAITNHNEKIIHSSFVFNGLIINGILSYIPEYSSPTVYNLTIWLKKCIDNLETTSSLLGPITKYTETREKNIKTYNREGQLHSYDDKPAIVTIKTISTRTSTRNSLETNLPYLNSSDQVKLEKNYITAEYVSPEKHESRSYNWYKNGKLHRESGAAIINPDGTEKYYLNDVEVNKSDVTKFDNQTDDFDKLIQLIKNIDRKDKIELLKMLTSDLLSEDI